MQLTTDTCAQLKLRLSEDELPSCVECFNAAPRHFVIKRFRTDFSAADAACIPADERKGKTEAELIDAVREHRKKLFAQEQRNAEWIRSVIELHPNLLCYKHQLPDSGTSAMVFEFCNCGDL